MYIQASDVLLIHIRTNIEKLPIIVTGLEEYFPVFSTWTVTRVAGQQSVKLLPYKNRMGVFKIIH